MSRFEPRWLESLSKLELPIQLLWGDADAVSPMSIPQTLAKLINPDYLSFTIFPDTGTQITEKLQSATVNLEIKKVKKHIKSYPVSIILYYLRARFKLLFNPLSDWGWGGGGH